MLTWTAMVVTCAVAQPTVCPSACASLQTHVKGQFTCDVASYAYDWGNRICEGILPLCVLRPADAEDVSAAVKVARATNSSLSYRSGGHSYTCNSIKADSIHLDLRSLNSATVQSSPHFNGTELSFGTGLNMRQLLDALGEGQMIVHGQCPTVGAGGLFLHGGIHTTLTLKYGRGNDTVVSMQVVTADGSILELSDASAHQSLWRAMRQAGSSFAIATRISAKVFDDVPSWKPTDGGDFFPVEVPRARMLEMVDGAADMEPGLPNYIHVNGVDFLIASADVSFVKNAAWLEEHVLERKLSAAEWAKSAAVRAFEQPVSEAEGGSDARFGKSGVIPYIYSTQEAFADVSFILPLTCYREPALRAALAALPERRDPATDLGCYLQVSTTYGRGHAFIDYNCPYDSEHYAALQRELDEHVRRLCPVGVLRYVNTPSTFLTARDYYANYDELAAIKAAYDPHELFRVYQGIRPTGAPTDAFERTFHFTRTRSAKDKINELGWDALKKVLNAKR